MTAEDRWELGSLFDSPHWTPSDERGRCPWEEHEARWLGCGRDALHVVITSQRFRRVWLPTYLCQEVVAAAQATGARCLTYPDSPLLARPEIEALPIVEGDAVVVVDYFGLRHVPRLETAATLIEDHTHAPTSRWALSSSADYCIASVRKLYPLPDGGVVWSPRGRTLPPAPPVRAELELAAFEKLSGMVLKRHYLDGAAIDKPLFRRLLAAGEGALYHAKPSSMTHLSRGLLGAFPLAAWQRQRQDNFDAFAEALSSPRGIRLHRPHQPDAIPFCALLELDTIDLRDHVHRFACQRRVYPSTLWPLDEPRLEGVSEEDRSLARRLLSVPIDMRYRPDDLRRAADVILEALSSDPGRTPSRP